MRLQMVRQITVSCHSGFEKLQLFGISFTCDGSVVLRFTSEDAYTESILRLARDVNAGDPRFSLWPYIRDSERPASKSPTLELDPRTFTNKIAWDFSNILNTHVHLSETPICPISFQSINLFHVSIPFESQVGSTAWN